MFIWTIIFYLGVLKAATLILSNLYAVFTQKINLENYKHGSVCVTGASDGIGKGLAYEFLIRGFKVVLVARNKNKLQEVCKELSERSKNPNVSFVVADFANSHHNPE